MQQMTDNEIRVAIANIDSAVDSAVEDAPDYLKSHDALTPVLAGLSEAEELAYICRLAGSNFALWGIESARAMIRATPRQKCEALLRAKGLWA